MNFFASPLIVLGTNAGLKLEAVPRHILGQLVDHRLDVGGRGDDGGHGSKCTADKSPALTVSPPPRYHPPALGSQRRGRPRRGCSSEGGSSHRPRTDVGPVKADRTSLPTDSGAAPGRTPKPRRRALLPAASLRRELASDATESFVRGDSGRLDAAPWPARPPVPAGPGSGHLRGTPECFVRCPEGPRQPVLPRASHSVPETGVLLGPQCGATTHAP